MYQEMMKMMGKVEIRASHPNGEIFAVRNIVNLVTNSGKRLAAMLFGLTTDSTTAQYIALGSTLTVITNSTQAIGEYIGANGAALIRAIATTSNVITTDSGDTAQYANTFTCNSDGMIVQEEAICQTDAAGWIAMVQTFGSITLNSGDTLAVVHKLSFA